MNDLAKSTDVMAAEAKFRTLVEQAIVGIYIIQGDRFVYVNPRMAQIFGHPQEAMTSRTLYDFIVPEDRALARENISKRISGGVSSIHYCLRMFHQSGTVLQIEAHGSRAEYDGQPAVMGTLLDITERTRAEDEIRQLNAELEQRVTMRTLELKSANEELEAFCYSVSHDLRAPLRHVHGYVELLNSETKGELSAKAQRYLRVIDQAAGDMGKLIDDLLAFSRDGRVAMRQTAVDLEQVTRRAVAGLEPQIKGRNIAWKMDTLPLVQGDPALIKQVFVNLISNALKYSRPRDPAAIEIGCAGHDENGWLILFVRDNGVGFDMQYAGKLFGVFQRMHRPDEFEGTGIGLANVRRVITRHGGRVWAEAKPGEGATFFFTLKPVPAP